jgi:acetylornithine deacetylase/succinyl-diaminopimelate desuccinylase-like protein
LTIDIPKQFIDNRWSGIVPVLADYIRIPNKSPAFDPSWDEHGHMERAVQLVVNWARATSLEGLNVSVHRLAGRTPLIMAVIPASSPATEDRTVVLYGHLDKQPETEGWREGLGPWEPVVEGERLYGRGGADDGYAAFTALTALEAVREAGGCHARCVLLIEASEESGSPDLPAHVDALADEIGLVDLVICLDSGCATYDRVWTTSSLRGIANLDLRVDVLTEGVHSGASGIVPSSFRVLRALLSRIEDQETGKILLDEANVGIPNERVEQAEAAAAVIGDLLAVEYPFAGTTRPVVESPSSMILSRTWMPALSVTALEGAPRLMEAGNVLRPFTAARLSMRLPPRCHAAGVLDALIRRLTDDAPYGAMVTISRAESADGWDAPATAPWLTDAIDDASVATFGQPAGALGIGGTIPFMGMLGQRFPAAQFFVTGVLGPGSNAHGPNEFLDLPTARRLTGCIASVLDAHGRLSPS